MKPAIFITLCILSKYSVADVVVPKDVLSMWGYETTEVREKNQDIKRIKGERWDESQVYYPRFTLSKSCFDSLASAVEKQKEILENQKSDPFKGAKSHYNDFISENCLYSISTSARATFLSYQSDLLKKYKSYVQESKNP